MMTASLLVQILQSLSILAIAVVGAWIAYHQMLTARVKLQSELFDKRYAIYEAVLTFVSEVLREPTVRLESVNELSFKSKCTIFLFDRSISDYIKMMTENAVFLRASQQQLRFATQQDDRIALTNSIERRAAWFVIQLEEAQNKFARYLKLPFTDQPSFRSELQHSVVSAWRSVIRNSP